MTGWGTRVEFVAPGGMFEKEPTPFENEYERRCFRLLRMVGILHSLGFQGLRIHPYLYPLGYRVELFPGTYADLDGARARPDLRLENDSGPLPNALRIVTSGGLTPEQLGTKPETPLSARQMAIRFIAEYPALAQASYYLDYAYAGWYAALLGHCEFGLLPYLYAELEGELGAIRLRKVEGREAPHMEYFPLPPTPSAGNTLVPAPRPSWMKAE